MYTKIDMDFCLYQYQIKFYVYSVADWILKISTRVGFANYNQHMYIISSELSYISSIEWNSKKVIILEPALRTSNRIEIIYEMQLIIHA